MEYEDDDKSRLHRSTKPSLNPRSIIYLTLVILGGIIVLMVIYSELQPTQTIDKMELWNSCNGTQLRGANILQRHTYFEIDGPSSELRPIGPGIIGPPYTQNDIDRLSALGANYVVVSHAGLFTETFPYTLDQSIQDNLDNTLDMIAEADMFATISLRTGPGRSESAFIGSEISSGLNGSLQHDKVWEDKDAQDAWVEMWRYTAERYRDNNVVVGYELMVEPNANELFFKIYDPQKFYSKYSGTLYDWHQLYPQITDAIRQVDTNTPILISSMEWGAVKWLPHLKPTGDERTVYTVHQYEPFHYTNQKPHSNYTYPGMLDVNLSGKEDQFDRVWLEGLMTNVDVFVEDSHAPVTVTEFGTVRWVPGAAEFMKDQMHLFESKGMNYAVWLWEPAWEPYTTQVNEYNFRYGPDGNKNLDVPSNDLMEIIVKHWSYNTLRPSSVINDPCQKEEYMIMIIG